MTKHRWQLALEVPGGHRYFRDMNAHGRVAVADNSGDYPHQTDDGVLWLDTTRPIIIGHGATFSASIPLLRDDVVGPCGMGTCWTGEDVDGAISVAEMFGLRLEVAESTTNPRTMRIVVHAVNGGKERHDD